jgi:beta-galactosidase
VWVYSNVDRVELFLNGESLGAKDMKKDSHLAWNVKYAPGAIEARGFKDGKQLLTARRETTGPAAKLVLNADRHEISADGEDVVMFAVEVQDAQGRYMPIADNQVNFRISGQAKVLGVGNGDPTSHESDQGGSRKAFNGLCMALVQSTKTAGEIALDATSPGLTPASLTISSRAVKLRPQVAVWRREIPAGEGITGLWRSAPVAAPAFGGGAFGAGATQIFTFRQSGSALTGTVEGGGGGRGMPSGDRPMPIEEGKVDGADISFTAAGVTYTGTVHGDQIELQRSGGAFAGRGGRRGAAEPTGPRPAIGPPPDGSDPSNGAFFGLGRGAAGRGRQTPPPLTLQRSKS